MHEQRIHHRSLIDNAEIAGERIGSVLPEAPLALDLTGSQSDAECGLDGSMEAASARDESVDDQNAVKGKETKNAVSFESHGKNQPEQHMHKSMIKK